MLLTSLIAVGLVSGNPWAQDEPKVVPREKLPDTMPQPVRRTSGAGGGLFVEFEVEYRQHDEFSYPMDYIHCVNACRGKRHADHAQCDPTCDDVCTAKHDSPIEPIVQENQNFSTWLGRLFQNLEGTKPVGLYPRRGKGSAGAVASHIRRVSTDYLTKPSLKKTQATVTPSAAHWNQRPCSSQVKKVNYFTYYVYVKYTVRDTFETITSGESHFATIYLPDPNLRTGLVNSNCKCSGLSTYSIEKLGDLFMPSPSGDEKKTRTRPVTGSGPPPKPAQEDDSKQGTKTSGLFFEEQDGVRVVTADDMGELGIGVQATSMNRVELTLTNTWATGVSLGLTPGTMLIAEDDDFQDITVAAPIALQFEAYETLVVSLDTRSPAQSANGFALCAEMDKKMPDGRVRYDFRSATDERMIDIAAVVARSGFRGPWHQAMMWIYADGATLDEINDRLIPGVSPRQYLNALFDLHDRCLADLRGRKYEDCFDPSLLDTTGSPPEAVAWFVSRLDEQALHGWAARARSRVQEMLSAEGEPFTHAAALVSAMAEREEVPLQTAAARLLEGLDLTGMDRLADAGALDSVAALLISDADGAVDAALDVFEKAPTQFVWGYLHSVSEGASRSNRDRAAALLERLNMDG